MSGCDFQMKRFSVQMHTKSQENKCWDCLNHKYNGGEGLDGEPCKQCEKHSNFKEADNGSTRDNKDN